MRCARTVDLVGDAWWTCGGGVVVKGGSDIHGTAAGGLEGHACFHVLGRRRRLRGKEVMATNVGIPFKTNVQTMFSSELCSSKQCGSAGPARK